MSGLYVRFIIQLLFYSVNAQNLVFILRTGERMVHCRFDRDYGMDCQEPRLGTKFMGYIGSIGIRVLGKGSCKEQEVGKFKIGKYLFKLER